MSLPVLLLAAVAVSAPSDGSVTKLSCSVALPDGKLFQLAGAYDGDGLRSNLSELTKVDGILAAAPDGIVITSDGTLSERWQLRNPLAGQKIIASLTQYGSRAALLVLEEQRFVGRHWGRHLIGVGYCTVRPQDGGKRS